MRNHSNQFIHRLGLAVVNIWESPWGAASIATLIYLVISAYSGKLFNASQHAYYNYLADAFLHGQFSLRILPPTTYDLSLFHGKYYLYWAPFPAILLMPFVALFGVEINDVLYTALFAAVNVGLIAKLLRTACKTNILYLSKPQRSILVVFFALGTVNLTLAPLGKVWQTGQVIAFTCTSAAYLAALTFKGRKAWFLTGLALSFAMLSRIQSVFVGFFLLVYLLHQEKPWNWKKVIVKIGYAALPLLLGLFFLIFYNYARFGNPLDVGQNYQLMNDFFKEDFTKYGMFNPYFIHINFYYEYIFYPFPLKPESLMGGSLFLLSPLFFAALYALWDQRTKWITWALFVSTLITNIPFMFLNGTGWVTFGPRHTLDFTVPLLLLTALGIEKWDKKIVIAFVIISIIHYLIGIWYLIEVL